MVIAAYMTRRERYEADPDRRDEVCRLCGEPEGGVHEEGCPMRRSMFKGQVRWEQTKKARGS